MHELIITDPGLDGMWFVYAGLALVLFVLMVWFSGARKLWWLEPLAIIPLVALVVCCVTPAYTYRDALQAAKTSALEQVGFTDVHFADGTIIAAKDGGIVYITLMHDTGHVWSYYSAEKQDFEETR